MHWPHPREAQKGASHHSKVQECQDVGGWADIASVQYLPPPTWSQWHSDFGPSRVEH